MNRTTRRIVTAASFVALAILPAAPAFAGDANLDGTVDSRDFLVWQRSSSPSTSSADLTVWRVAYGR